LVQAEEGKNGKYTEVTGRKPEVGTGGGYQLFFPRRERKETENAEINL
jgi:hypothetical protein